MEKNTNNKLVFLNGLGGTGKSTLVHYFLEHPLQGWSFYDFDYGKYKADNKKEKEKLGASWRELQTKWWLQVAKKHGEVHGSNIIVAGVSTFPWQIKEYPEYDELDEMEVHFGFLSLSHDERRRRLEERGDLHLWDPSKTEKFDTLLERMKEERAVEFCVDGKSVEEVGREVEEWLDHI